MGGANKGRLVSPRGCSPRPLRQEVRFRPPPRKNEPTQFEVIMKDEIPTRILNAISDCLPVPPPEPIWEEWTLNRIFTETQHRTASEITEMAILQLAGVVQR